jgi:thioredoxin-dependent peroxiredoxin
MGETKNGRYSQYYLCQNRNPDSSTRRYSLKKQPMSLSSFLSISPLTLLYFYPKDDTTGCTMEAQDFTRLKKEFEALGIQIIGVSKDSETSHAKFSTKCNLGIDLISDEDGSLHNQFGVIGEKKNYGKVYIGVIRSTFLLDQSGKILKEWRNVKATGHAEKVLREVKEII